MADHDALDRRFVDTGPFLNRALAARIRHGLRVGHTRLPSALVREDATRLAQADALSERLVPGAWDEASLRALAEFVEGRTRRPLGELVQEAVGRLFKPSYQATKETWQAALAMEAHLRSWNPITRIIADIRDDARDRVPGTQVRLHRQGRLPGFFRRLVTRFEQAADGFLHQFAQRAAGAALDKLCQCTE
mgnify:CR=1 FL=1